MEYLTLDEAVRLNQDRFENALHQAVMRSLTDLGEDIKNLDWANVSLASGSMPEMRAA